MGAILMKQICTVHRKCGRTELSATRQQHSGVRRTQPAGWPGHAGRGQWRERAAHHEADAASFIEYAPALYSRRHVISGECGREGWTMKHLKSEDQRPIQRRIVIFRPVSDEGLPELHRIPR